jgi:hypothetical protein
VCYTAAPRRLRARVLEKQKFTIGLSQIKSEFRSEGADCCH